MILAAAFVRTMLYGGFGEKKFHIIESLVSME
jgi:hypothetical protein